MDDKPSSVVSRSEKGILSFIIAYMAVLAPTGYVIGINFYIGGMAEYGISTSSFPLDIQQTYVYAYYAVAIILAGIKEWVEGVFFTLTSWPGNLFSTLLLALLTIIFYLIIKRHEIKHRFFSEWEIEAGKKVTSYLSTETNDLSRAMTVTGIITMFAVGIFVILFGLFSIWAASAALGAHAGKEFAIEKRNEYLEKGCFYKEDSLWSNCRQLVSDEGDILLEGILVFHNGDYIAFFNKDGSFTKHIPPTATIRNLMAKENTMAHQ